MIDNRLKPCPFCGQNHAHVIKNVCEANDFTAYYVACLEESGCRMKDYETDLFDTEEQAIAAWNRRVE